MAEGGVRRRTASAVGGGGVGGDVGTDEKEGHVGHLLVRIHVPELNVQKCLQFPRDQLVWDVKQQCLAALPKVCIILVFGFIFLTYIISQVLTPVLGKNSNS
nr:unnamed protein product [Callosobruchus analis]